MRTRPGLSALALMCVVICGPAARAQESGGDQFLDGIGETALIARYVLDGDAEDWSRNALHATARGDGVEFVDDSQFGKVLSLSGESGGYLEIPSHALADADTLSFSGWVFVRSDTPWQRLFDFGQDTTRNFFATPVGPDEQEGYRARITSSGWTEEQGPTAPRVPLNQWVHLAVVLDAAEQTLTLYADGERVARAADVTLTMEDVIDQEDPDANQLHIGRSKYDTDTDLNAKLHDVRLYSIPLSDEQVATIRQNALGEGDAVAASSGDEDAGDTQDAAMGEADAKPEALGLAEVPDITAETVVGHLPRLPYYIPGVYEGGAEGPPVRVIWPAPEDNRQALEAGTYTVTGVVPGTSFEPKATVTVTEASEPPTAPERKLEAFPLGQVVLNPDDQGRTTPFMANRDKFVLTLAETDPDSFLYMFRNAFGQPQPEGARSLGGWDSQTTKLRGHASGHYLSAIAQAYAGAAYDEELRANFQQKMDYLIETLYDLSQMSGKPAEEGGPHNADPAAVPPGPDKEGYSSDLSRDGIRNDYWNWGEGFISAYPPDQFILLEQGATYGGSDRQVWAPYYTLHKILAGLLDCYEVGGNEKALEVAKGMGLWVHARLSQAPDETRIRMWNRYIAGEYGGMNEVMARLHRLTDDERFLKGAQLFDNIDFFFGDAERSHGLARNVDTIRGKHANQHIPQITGALETYRVTQEPRYFLVADNFWNMSTGAYMYAIGGVAGASNPRNAECFTAEPNTLYENGFARGGQNETCATYNLLKLSRQLFLFEPRAKYMDYYEQALYNHILASVDEDNPGNTYHVPLNPGSRKGFGNARMNGFTCCNGTALESSTKLQDSIYFRSADNEALYVNLYVPSTLTWDQRDVKVTQSTSFPYSDSTKLTIDGAGRFDLNVRVPDWAAEGFFVTINGQEQQVEATPGEYLTLSRDWSAGDTVELRMPFTFHLSPVMDQPNIASIFYGPVLLAAEEPSARSDWRPLTLDADDLGESISGDPSTLRFEIGDVRLKPFFETYDRYSVYFDVTLE